MKSLNLLIGTVAWGCCASLGLANTLDWGVTGSAWSNHTATAALYATTPAAEGSSWLAQLIWAGPNGQIDAATQVAGGTSGDDVVVAYKWIGFGVPGVLGQGRWQCSGVNGYENLRGDGACYYIRVWEAPSSGVLGLAPTGATYYGDSELFTVQNFGLGLPETFQPAAQPTWHPIPALDQRNFTVTVLGVPADGGTVTGGGLFAQNTVRQLAATAATGWVFTSWNDGIAQNPRTIVVPGSNVTYAATFVRSPVSLALGQALNAPGLTWQTGGDAGWSTSTTASHDGLAARSGALTAAGQQSWIQTTTNGPGSLIFWWQLGAGPSNTLQFTVNGVPQTLLTGAAGWQEYAVFLATTNTYTLRWTFAQHAAPAAGSSAGGLDQVQWMPCAYATHVPQLFYQDPNGLLASWVLNGTGGFRFARVLANTGSWALKAAGDVDGDGVSDLLFQTPSGDIAGWFMNPDGSVRNARVWFNVSGWEVKACGDFEGLGHGQLFFQTAAGQTAYWRLDTNGNFQSSVSLGNLGDWKLRGIGSLDGDRRANLLWQNSAGAIAIWFHNSDGSLRGAVPFNTGGWILSGVTDIDGDGVSDLLWQTADGSTAGWLMNSNATVRTASYWWNTGGWKLKAAGH